jgi:hypothetical protein
MIPTPGRSPRLPAAKKRDRAAARRRAADHSVPVEPVVLPIDRKEVLCIASVGYPLWESLEVMQLRNRRITLAYGDLSVQLARLVAGDGAGDGEGADARYDANWCTFACWSSKTIGDWIAADASSKSLGDMRHLPRLVVDWLVGLSRYLTQRENGASYRALAAGNRFVFLEVGQSVARFIETFGRVPRDKPNEDDWTTYWDEVSQTIAEMSQLDLSWMLTETPPPDDLRLGLRQYYEALFATDPKVRAQHMLAGNLLLGVYEQRRVDGYLAASLALYPDRAMRRLVQHHSGLLTGWRRWPSSLYSRLMTFGLILDLPGERLRVGRPLPAPPDATDGELFPPDLRTITLPLLQALLTRWDLSEGEPARRRAREWTSLDDRMSYIANMFRSRQQCEVMFGDPFSGEVAASLLAGELT